MVILLILPFVNAVPTFNLFNGNVLCDSSVQTGYAITANVTNGTDIFSVIGGVSGSGEYAIVVGAANGYNVSFYVDDVFVEKVEYDESLININNDLVLASDHDLCYVAPADPPADTPGGGGGGPSAPSTPSVPSNDDDSTDDDSVGDVVVGDWEPTDDGSAVDVSEETTEVVTNGGEYVLVIDESPYDFSVYAVNSESAKIWIDDAEYIVPVNSNVELEIDGRIVLASYLETQDGLARLSFQNAGVRATQSFNIMYVVYIVAGIIVIGVGIFFLIKKLSGEKPKFKSNKKDSDSGLLSGPKK